MVRFDGQPGASPDFIVAQIANRRCPQESAMPPCLIGMEAWATAHYWARELTKLGHKARLMPAKDVLGTNTFEQNWRTFRRASAESRVLGKLDFLRGAGAAQKFARRTAIVAGQLLQPLRITHQNMGGVDLDTDQLQLGEGTRQGCECTGSHGRPKCARCVCHSRLRRWPNRDRRSTLPPRQSYLPWRRPRLPPRPRRRSCDRASPIPRSR
jgi:hypothetical protein